MKHLIIFSLFLALSSCKAQPLPQAQIWGNSRIGVRASDTTGYATLAQLKPFFLADKGVWSSDASGIFYQSAAIQRMRLFDDGRVSVGGIVNRYSKFNVLGGVNLDSIIMGNSYQTMDGLDFIMSVNGNVSDPNLRLTPKGELILLDNIATDFSTYINAFKNGSSGGYNTVVAEGALSLLTAGSYNVAVGVNAAASLVNGNNNTAVGYSANFSPTISYGTAIGSGALVTNSNETVIAAGGNNALLITPTLILPQNGRTFGGTFTGAVNAASVNIPVAPTSTTNNFMWTVGINGALEKQDFNVFQNLSNSSDTAAVTGLVTTFGLSSLTSSLDLGIWTNILDSVIINLVQPLKDNQMLTVSMNRRVIMGQGRYIVFKYGGAEVFRIINDSLGILTYDYEFNDPTPLITCVLQYVKKRNTWRLISYQVV